MPLVTALIPQFIGHPFTGFISVKNLALVGEKEIGSNRGVELCDASNRVLEAAASIHRPVTAQALVLSKDIRQRRGATASTEMPDERPVKIGAKKPDVRHVGLLNTRALPVAIFSPAGARIGLSRPGGASRA
jgi:hypothetical protein